MPREISTAFRRELEEPRSTELVVILLEISHPSLAVPIRVANDTVHYLYNGNTYIGFPFEIDLLGDDEQIPRGQLKIQNVDRQIGEAILELTTPPSLTITIVAGSDFGETSAADHYQAVPLVDEPGIEYQATHLMFGNIQVDAMAVVGEIKSFEVSSEPWPAIRTTAERLPGLDP